MDVHVKLGDLSQINIPKKPVEISKEDIDAVIENWLSQVAPFQEKEGEAQNGDRVILDFEGFIDGEAFEGGKAEKYPLDLGSRRFIPGFEEQLVGVKAEEDQEIKINFPEDYPHENLAGKEATFACHIHNVQAQEKPEINDELFQTHFGPDTSVQKTRDDIQKELEKRRRKELNRDRENEILVAFADASEIDITDEMVQSEVERMAAEKQMEFLQQGKRLEDALKAEGKTLDDFKSDIKEHAHRRLQIHYLLQEFVKEEGITVSHKEIDSAMRDVAKQQGYDKESDKFRKFFDDSQKRKEVMEQLKMQKAIDMVVNKVNENLKDESKTNENA